MKCPNCGKSTAKRVGEDVPITHLNTGVSIMWCSTCGTIFRNSDFTDDVRVVMVPERGKL